MARGYATQRAPNKTRTWNTNIMKNVRPKIWSTSQPVNTGFSTGGGPTGAVGKTESEIGGMSESREIPSGDRISTAGGAAFTDGRGSNSGLSDDDKEKIL